MAFLPLLLGVGAGAAALILCLRAATKANAARAKHRFDYTLIPNCLMTRYPVVFVHGKKSIFYHAAYWNFLPDYVGDHGYEVVQLDLPWRNEVERKKDLDRFLDVLERDVLEDGERLPCHWIADASSRELLDKARQAHPRIFASLNFAEDIVKNAVKNAEMPPGRPWDLVFHGLFGGHLPAAAVGHPKVANPRTIGKAYLKRLVYLAEQDLHREDPHESALSTFT